MSKLSPRITKQYSAGGGLRSPQVSRTGRGISPSYGDNFQSLAIAGYENVTVTLTIPSMSANTATTISGSQGFQNLNALTVTSSDLGQFHIGNVNVNAPYPAVIIGHPQFQVTTNQGTPPGGVLAAGQSYSNVQISITMNVYATQAVTASPFTVTATVMLLGTALGN